MTAKKKSNKQHGSMVPAATPEAKEVKEPRPTFALDEFEKKLGKTVGELSMEELGKLIVFREGVLTKESVENYVKDLEKFAISQKHDALSSLYLIHELRKDTERALKKMNELDTDENKDEKGYRKPAIQKEYAKCQATLNQNAEVLRSKREKINDALEYVPYAEKLILAIKSDMPNG